MQTVKEIMKEYNQTDRIKRDQMWIMFIELRDEFDEMERSNKNAWQNLDLKASIDWHRKNFRYF